MIVELFLVVVFDNFKYNAHTQKSKIMLNKVTEHYYLFKMKLKRIKIYTW